MSVDRILTLKLVTDVGDISQKMTGVSSDIGRVGSAITTLKGFAGPVVIDAAITGISMLGSAIGTGMADVRAYDDAVYGLSQTLSGLPSGEVAALASDLTAIGTSLGFGDDAALVRGLQTAELKLGDLATAQEAVGLAMDVARAKGTDFDTALNLVIGSSLGLTRNMRELGVEGATVDERMASISSTFGTAAEDFTSTAEGARQVADAMAGDVFEAIGSAVNDLVDKALPVLMDLWTEWQPVLLQLANGVGPVFDGIAAAVQKVVDLFGALAPHLQAAWDLMSPIVDMIVENVGNMFTGIGELIDALILILEGGDIGDAFDKAFSGIVNIVKGPINAMLGVVEGGLNFLGSLFMDALEAIRSNLNGIAFVGDQVPDEKIVWTPISVPRLASGGIVDSPTLALIGEGGPEAVVPLDRAGGLGGITVVIQGLVTDPAAAGRAVVDAIRAYERRSGAGWRAA